MLVGGFLARAQQAGPRRHFSCSWFRANRRFAWRRIFQGASHFRLLVIERYFLAEVCSDCLAGCNVGRTWVGFDPVFPNGIER